MPPFMQTDKVSRLLGLVESPRAASPSVNAAATASMTPTITTSLPLRGPAQPPSCAHASTHPRRAAAVTMSASEAAASHDGRGLFPTRERLVDLCDDVRASLRDDIGLGPRGVEIDEFLQHMLAGEAGESLAIDIHTIQHAALDTLLIELASTDEGLVASQQHRERLCRAKAAAAALRRCWIARFCAAYFGLGQARYRELTRTGALRDTQCVVVGEDWQPWWRLKEPEKKTTAVDQSVKPGRWWCNLAAAQRDGVVCHASDAPAIGPNGILTVPLMWGHEKQCAEPDTTMYTRESAFASLPVMLLRFVGAKVAILRGHRLISGLAPTVGVRYDGLHKLSHWGYRQIGRNLYRVTFTLRREPGQVPMKLIHPSIPRPSHFDDWIMFQRAESDAVVEERGEAGLVEWKRLREKERADLDLWRSTRELTATVDAAVARMRARQAAEAQARAQPQAEPSPSL